MKLVCEYCNKTFIHGKGYHKRFCHPDCQKASIRERLRNAPLIICKECGCKFRTQRINREYCKSCTEILNNIDNGYAMSNKELEFISPEFYALIKPPEKKKKRKCLKCASVFDSTKSNRICASCNSSNTKLGIRAGTDMIVEIART